MRLRSAGERVLLTLWVGSLWAIGYIAAPVLFSVLDDRATAGRLAGEMFTATAVLGLLCGGFLLMLQWLRRPSPRNWRLWVIAAMVLITALGEFALRPLMSAAGGAEFGRLHGFSQLLFLAVSLLGLGLVAFGLEPIRELEGDD